MEHIVLHVITIILALVALVIWVMNCIRLWNKRPQASIFALVILAFLVNFTAYHIVVGVFLATAESLPPACLLMVVESILSTNTFLIWAAVVRFHAAFSMLILALLSRSYSAKPWCNGGQ